MAQRSTPGNGSDEIAIAGIPWYYDGDYPQLLGLFEDRERLKP